MMYAEKIVVILLDQSIQGLLRNPKTIAAHWIGKIVLQESAGVFAKIPATPLHLAMGNAFGKGANGGIHYTFVLRNAISEVFLHPFTSF